MMKCTRKEVIIEDGYYLLEEIFNDIKTAKKTGLILFFRVEFRDNHGRITIIPWDLDFRSKILNYFIDVFPPHGSTIKDFYLNGNNELCIFYKDVGSPYDTENFYPFGLDRKSEWLAIFNFIEQEWRLERIEVI